jgi:hypothetical protein
MKKYAISLFAIALLVLLSACSNRSSTPVAPSLNQSLTEIPCVDAVEFHTGRTLLGVWDAEFDPESLEVHVKPCRETTAHFNITASIPAPTFSVVSFDPLQGILTVDVTVRNPFNIDGYDLRMIVFTDNTGNRLLNPDDWTPLYDIAGGSQVNPFVAYAKTVAYRKFAAHSQNTERMQLYFPSGFPTVNFAVDVSYPGNCDEPYEIRNFNQGVLYDSMGYSTPVNIDVYDWQSDTNSVLLYCPAIIGSSPLSLNRTTTITWGNSLVNSNGASAGNYNGYIAATSANSGTLALYDGVIITVSTTCKNGWAVTWGGSSYDWGYGLAIGPDQNVYVTGRFAGQVDFDPGPLTLNFDSGGDDDIYLSKFNSYGNLIWARAWDIGYLNLGMGVASDSTGVYITGGGVSLRKYNHSGDFIREYYWGGYGEDICYNLVSDSYDNIHTVGVFEETVDFDPGSGVDNQTSAGSKDVFVSKLSSNGDYIWAKTCGGTNYHSGNDLIFDDYGSFYVTGSFVGTTDFCPGSGVYELVSSGYPYGYDDAYLAKYNSNGDFSWAKGWGDVMSQSADDLAYKAGNIYVGGCFESQVDFDPDNGISDIWIMNSNGALDGYVSKISTSGDFSWAFQIGGTGYDDVTSVETDLSGNIIVAGKFEDTVDFDPGVGSEQHTSNGFSDFFLCKYGSDGSHIWTRVWGGVNYDYGWDIAVDRFDNIYLTGYFMGTVDFDPGTGVSNRTSNGENDAFLIKVLPNGNW